MKCHTLLGALCTFAIAGTTLAQTIVIPSSLALAPGFGSTAYPWNRTTSQIRVQYCYDSSHFTTQGISMPILINQIRWRAYASTATWTGGTYGNVVIDMSSSAVDQASMGTIFDANHGLDRANVFTGQVQVPAGAGNGTTVPGPWYVTVVFTSPFLYDPSSGADLLLDIAMDGTWSGGTSSTMGVATSSQNALTSRVYDLSNWQSTTGTFQADVGPACEVAYSPASGLYANFDASLRSGASPLTVNFTDTSFTSDPGGVTTWNWDLDGDGITDSFAPNPSFTYNTCGTYDVTLTVTDSTHSPSTVTKTGFIDVDPQMRVNADFSGTPTLGSAPLTVSFTDATSGSPTSWTWDLDGDGAPDSFSQNPSFTYNLPGRFNVTLTAANACYSDTETKAGYVVVVGATGNTRSAEILEYPFNEVRGSTTYNTASTTLAPEFGVLPHSVWQRDAGRVGFMGNEAGFGCLSYSATNANWVDSGWPVNHTGSLTIMFWMRRDPASTASSPFGYPFGDGSFRAFTGSAGILLGGHGVISGTYTANFSGLLTPGVWHHYAIVIDDAAGTATWFEDAVPHASPASFTPGTYVYSGSSNFSVGTNGSGTSYATRHFDLDDFRFYGRALTQLDIQNAMMHENATTGRFDSGCAGPGATPLISSSTAPTPASPGFSIDLSNAEPGRPGLLVIGFAASNWLGALPLPFNLDFLYGPGSGCALTAGIDVPAAINTGSGSLSFPAPIPGGTQGVHAYAEYILLGSVGATTGTLDINIQLP